jgi:hypothetical protein
MDFYAVIPSGALRVTGSDRVPFVHGQVSNDVRGLPIPGACRAAILNAKGQIEFDVRIHRRAEDLLIQTHDDLSGAVYERLKRYIVFDDVRLEDISQQISVFHVSAALASSLGFDVNGAAVQALEGAFGAVLASRVERGLEGGVDLHLSRDRADEIETFLNPRGERWSASHLELARLRAGLPDAHRDAFLERLPQECGLEHAVSYKKGCYIGQEIMARLEARGNPRYALQRVTLERPVRAGEAVKSDGRTVGQVGSSLADGNEALGVAVLRRDLEPGAVLSADGVVLRLRP